VNDSEDRVFQIDLTPPTYPDFGNLQVSVDDDLAVITMGTQEGSAIVTTAMTPELTECFKLMRDDRRIRAAVITGRGSRFSAGGDVKKMNARAAAMSVPDNPGWVQRLPVDHATDFMYALLDLPFPVVGAVNGHAIGAGLRIALLCDVLVISESARVGDTHVLRGLVAPQPFLLNAAVGSMRAKAMLLTGKLLTGNQAVEYGIAERAVPAEDVLPIALTLARELADLPPLAVRWTKKLLNNRMREAVAQYATEAYALEALTMLSADHAEAAASFVEKREPRRYEGR
jgi:enoyl-CoA hydratase/carnithine racemase